MSLVGYLVRLQVDRVLSQDLFFLKNGFSLQLKVILELFQVDKHVQYKDYFTFLTGNIVPQIPDLTLYLILFIFHSYNAPQLPELSAY